MNLAELPFISRLERASSVLVAGAGGGFDVFSGLPLFFHLRQRGKRVHLANLSFTNLRGVRGPRPAPGVVRVDASTDGPAHYFPERALAEWLAAHDEATPVFAFERSGCRPLIDAYRALQQELGLEAIVLVDGGTDILMRGDEAGLGTPEEDITSLAAVHELDVAEKLVICLGFGVDRHHGVCHAHFLEGVADLSRRGGFLGTATLLAEMPEVRRYREAVAFACDRTPDHPSIVSLSVVSSIEGEYGDVHRTARTQGSRLWINPLMSLYWAFDLDAVARRCLYLDELRNTRTPFEVAAIIEAFRMSHDSKPWEDIPV